MDQIISNAELISLILEVALVLAGIIVIMISIGIAKKIIGRQIKERKRRNKAKKIVNIVGCVIMAVFIPWASRGKFGIVSIILIILLIAGIFLIFRIKEFILSISGWISIVISRTYNTGDRISLGGVKGDVIDLGITKTTIMEIGQWVDGDLYNGKIVKIPNSLVFGEPVHNYSANFPFVWDEIKLPIRYGSDYKTAKKVIGKVAERIVGDYALEAREHWDKMVKKFLIEDISIHPLVTIEANDNWIECTLRYVVDYKKRRIIKDALFTEILEEIDKDIYNIELASATFEIVGASAIGVTMKTNR